MIRTVEVALTPDLLPAGQPAGGVAVVIDVLRMTTTVVTALAAGCASVRPCVEIAEAQALAQALTGRVLLAGERDGKPLPGFALGNSPGEYTTAVCKGATLVLTTTNGTRAVLRAASAQRVVLGAFVNFSAVCELLRGETGPVHIICAGHRGTPALEDTLLAGAFVDYLSETGDVALNDSARLAWDCFENQGRLLAGALEISAGGQALRALGYAADLDLAARVDQFALVPEYRSNPPRLEPTAVCLIRSYWPHRETTRWT